MADVIDDDRGQLLLVAGLMIAITFVLLVLVLNTVIYTENLGTRSSDVGGDDAIAYERAAVDHVAALLPYHLPETDAETAFAEEIEEWVRWSQRHTLTNANLVGVTVAEEDMTGTRIRHTDSSRAFTDADGGGRRRRGLDARHRRRTHPPVSDLGPSGGERIEHSRRVRRRDRPVSRGDR